MKKIKQKLALILILITVLIIAGCTRLQIAYNFAPRLIANSLDDNFDFTSNRYSEVKQAISNDFKNNESTLKKGLLDHLEYLLKVSENNQISKQQVQYFYSQVRVSQLKLVEIFKPTLSEVIDKMSEEELRSYKYEVQKKLNKSEERLSSIESYEEKSAENFEDTMETIFDEVTDEQMRLYKNFIGKHYEYFKLQLEYRKSFLKKFGELSNNKGELKQLITQHFSADDSLKTPQHLKARQKFLDDMFIETVNLWKTLSPKQLSHAREFLNGLKVSALTLKM